MEISEAQASPEVAALYADIKATAGTGVVPLVYRRIAAWPDVLAWCWGMLRPAYASGRLGRSAAELMAGIRLPPLRPWSSTVLEAAGIDGNAARTIADVLEAYSRSNPANLIALSALRTAMREPPPAHPVSPQEQGPSAATRAADQAQELPAMRSPQDMEERTVALIRELTGIGGEAPGASLPSVYRQLAHWPGFFPLAITLLGAYEADGRLAAAVDEAAAQAQHEADGLKAALQAPGSPAPDVESLRAVEALLDAFTAALPRMLFTTKLFRAALPVASAGSGPTP